MEPTDSLPTQADTVVVGAGIVGCNVAYQLTQLGREDVVVVDWRRGTPLPVVLDDALDVAARDVEEFAHAGASVTPTTREGGR